jgi:hypothetical protein
MEVPRRVRTRLPRPRGAPGPDVTGPALSWIGDERIAISGVPPAWAVARLAEQAPAALADTGADPGWHSGFTFGFAAGLASGARPQYGTAMSGLAGGPG